MECLDSEKIATPAEKGGEPSVKTPMQTSGLRVDKKDALRSSAHRYALGKSEQHTGLFLQGKGCITCYLPRG